MGEIILVEREWTEKLLTMNPMKKQITKTNISSESIKYLVDKYIKNVST